MTSNRTALIETERKISTLTDLTECEKELLWLYASCDENERFVMFEMMKCIGSFGEEYLNEAKPYVEARNREGILAVTKKYISRLNGVEQ